MIRPVNRPEPLLVSAREAARMLSVSERTLWTLRQRGEIPAVPVMGSIRYSVDDLRSFIERQKAAQ